MNLPRINVLGVCISAINMDVALGKIMEWLEHTDRQYVSVCTVHTVMECQQDVMMRRAINGAGMATPDGMPLVWLGNLLAREKVSRVYGPDLLLALCELSAERGYSQYFYGGAPGVPEALARNLQDRYPGLQVAGAFSPPFRPLTDTEDAEIVDRINQAAPDIVWVGLGTPKQDLWMVSHRERLSAPVMIAVGAAFDFHTGRIPQAPKWMQKSGLEWFFRLTKEPKRLWRRYLIYNPLFIFSLLMQLLGLRKYSLTDSTQ